MKVRFYALLLALVLVSSFSVVALYESNYGGYSGAASRARRAYDPFSRDQYFGESYRKPFGGFGMKGPISGRMVGTGQKSAYSGVFNLDTNDFSRQGRNPKRISNWDARFRGNNRLDVVALWTSVDGVLEKQFPSGRATGVQHRTKCSVRLVMVTDE